LTTPQNEALPESKKPSSPFLIFVWTLFDFANTSFSIVVVTFLYAVYFKNVVAGGKPIGDFYWSLGTSIAMIVTALISPVLGAIADYSTGKKRFLLFFTLQCIIFTTLLFFVREGDIFIGLLFFILANIGFEAGLVFYDAFLPEITTPKNYGRVSGYGFGMGYLGSLATLVVIYPFIHSDSVSNLSVRATFLVAAGFFFIFATPLFVFLKDNRREIPRPESYLKIGLGRVFSTLSHIRNIKNLAIFLLSFFFYIEGVNTVIFFAGIYASTTLHFGTVDLLIFFATVQTTAILGSVILGIVADAIGQKRTIIITLFMWIATVTLAYFTETKSSFYIVGLLAGASMGSCQSSSRSLMSSLTPSERKTEFFGFYSFFGKSSAVVGPTVFGIISYITGNQHTAILSTLFFFVTGLIILFFVEDTSHQKSSDQNSGQLSE
jgi:UMF1 family MFS transporter